MFLSSAAVYDLPRVYSLKKKNKKLGDVTVLTYSSGFVRYRRRAANVLPIKLFPFSRTDGVFFRRLLADRDAARGFASFPKPDRLFSIENEEISGPDRL